MKENLLQILFALLLATPFTTLQAQLPPPCPNGIEPAEDCESACVTCSFNGYLGNTAGFAGGTVPNYCSQIQNDQWIGFIAGASSATFTVQPANCIAGNGIQVALYGGCGESFIACNGGAAGNGNVPTSINASLTPGTNYYLLIDGYSGDECDFSITVDPPTAVQAQPLGPVGAMTGPVVACPNATVTYTVPNVTNAGGYTWTVPADATVNGLPSGTTFDAPGGHIVDVTFGSTGGQVCVEAANSCFGASAAVCKNVQIAPIPPTILPKVVVCNEDVPYTLPWGQTVSISGNYTRNYQTDVGCDSIVTQQVIIKPAIEVTQLPQVICQGSCVNVCGQDFCETGQVIKHCTSYQGCDSLVDFQLTVLHPVAEILGGNLLSCANTTLTLNSATAPANSIKTWTKPDGTVLANAVNSIVVIQPDTIILTTTQTQAGVSCSQADTLIITANFTAPTATAAVNGMLACHQPTVQLLGGSTTPGASFHWTGPNGFSVTGMSPIAYAAGTYTLVVTHPVSHCTATATVQVLAEPNLPTATTSGGTLNCLVNSVTLTTTTTANTPTFAWMGPNGFTSSLSHPNVSLPGTYTVTVTDSITTCVVIAVAEVLQNIVPPPVTVAAANNALTCAQPSTLLLASTTAANPTYFWTGPGGFSSSLPQPTVSVAGLYTVQITAGGSGCTAAATALVVTDTVTPGAMAVGGHLGCAGEPVTLQGSSPTANVTFTWTGPGFVSSAPNPTVTQVGTYILLVTASNGCVSAATTQVGPAQIPVISNVQASNDQNGQGVGAINLTITGSTLYSVSWTLNGQQYATTQNLANLHAGVYCAVVTSFDQCVDTVCVTVDNVVATGEPGATDWWTIAPNPANGFLEVHFLGDGFSDAQLNLFDMLGRKVLAENMGHSSTMRLGVKNLPTGQYQLMIQYSGQTVLRSVVIQH